MSPVSLSKLDVEMLCGVGVIEALRLMRTGAVSSVELVHACLERVATREPVVRAWAHLLPAPAMLALGEARDAERAASALRGPLHGLPVAAKDVFDTEDLPTEYGSPIYRGNRPTCDASCVALLRAAGAIVMGKTVTCEFANYPPSRTCNPRDLTRTPGGSSSGSAAAVADGHVAIALGTQTAGSIIRPAAFNGVIGYKPSYDAYSREGVLPLAPSLDTVGFFVRQLEDLRLIHGVLRGRGSSDESPSVGNGPPRVGIVRTPWWECGEPDMQAAFERTAEALRMAGARVTEVEVPKDFAEVLPAHEAIFSGEAARAFAQELKKHPHLIAASMREKLLLPGLAVSDEQLVQASGVLRHWRSRLARLAGAVDVLLTPAARGEAPEGLNSTGDPIFNRVWTALHLPCLCYPVGVGPHGMPLAVQVVGRLDEDHALIDHAIWMGAHSMSPIRVHASFA